MEARQASRFSRFTRDVGRILLHGRLRRQRAGPAFQFGFALAAYCFNAAQDLLSRRFPLASLYVAHPILEIPFIHKVIDDVAGPNNVAFELGSSVWPYLSRRLKEVTVCDWSYGFDPSDPSEVPPNVTIMKTDFLEAELPAESFDVVLSVSTVQCIGMGEYGDPLYADGDRAAVLGLHRVLKPGGLMVLSLPFGRAADSWYRVYDPERLRSLLQGINVTAETYWIWKFPWWRRATAAQAAGIDSITRDRLRATVIIQAKKERATGKPGNGGLS